MRVNVRDIISAVVFYGAALLILTILVRVGRTYGWAKVDEEFKLMEPALPRGHYKWIDKRAGTTESLHYNDLIMFETPPWKRVAWDYEFGRVIGLPGDLVEMRYGQVRRVERTDSGLAEPEKLVEPYVPPYQRPEDFGQFIVPRNAVFILFDQRRRRPPLRDLIVPERVIYGRVIR
jgi:signal peptidase I